MSQMLINAYLADLARTRRVSGARNEESIREAFKDLLKGYARAQGLVFVPEWRMAPTPRTSIRLDGAILHELRIPLGYWEAKDTDDDLDREIAKKLRSGYPQDNILFENSAAAVLIQDRREVARCDTTDTAALARLLALFFGYERPEIAQFRRAVAQFQADLPAILQALRERIEAAYAGNGAFRATAARFLQHAQETIDPSLAEADVREMLIQHVLTEDIFTQVFADGQYHRENNIARELTALEDAFFTGAVKHDTLRAMLPYYAAIRAGAAQIAGHDEKQKFLKAIYEGFYKSYNPKAADRLGVVYTPGEVVRFMIEGADWLCQRHFGRSLIDEGVEILDPATGTGTFVCELLNMFSGQPEKLRRKYKEELHANEVAILPYYVANLNIEATYAAIAGQYAEFENLCFVDTLDNVAGLGVRKGMTPDLFGALSEENVARVKRQNLRKISVVIGNPPYNAWQENFNQRNPNRAYKKIDQRIKETYVKKGTAQNKSSVYDMYVRFFRWASDRVHDDGIVAFITNRNLIEKAAFDGFRRDLMDEFHEVYVVDLGGDVRANPKLSGTRNNVFGIQTGVAITFLVKKQQSKGCIVRYSRRDEAETREDKLSWLGSTKPWDVTFEQVEPDPRSNWVNLNQNDWQQLHPLVSSEVKARKRGWGDEAIFRVYTNGVQTKKDDWMFDFSLQEMGAKAKHLIETYEAARNSGRQINDTIKWDRELQRRLTNNIPIAEVMSPIVEATYRPFVPKYFYFDRHFIALPYLWPALYNPSDANTYVCISNGLRSSFACLATSNVSSIDMFVPDMMQAVPRYRYTPKGERLDNVTDWALKQFRDRYGKAEVTKDAIFAYAYAALHDPVWRDAYAINLRREFPRLPFHPDFAQWAAWGGALLDLHIGYESVEPWPLARADAPDPAARASGRPPKPILRSDPATGTIALDSETTLSGVPPEAFAYRLGNRSAIDWVLDQHKERAPRDPTIRARFDTYRFADHKERVAGLLARVARVAVGTMAVVEAMRAAPRG